MMVPKKRVSHSRTHTRRAHDALTRTHAVICPNCGEPTLRHRVCPGCGQYRGKQMVNVESETK